MPFCHNYINSYIFDYFIIHILCNDTSTENIQFSEHSLNLYFRCKIDYYFWHVQNNNNYCKIVFI